MKGEELKLEEVAQRAGISARTVRYYVQRGLLPPPSFRGKDSSYGHTHLTRLKVIRALQAAFYPLESIKAVLDSKDDHALLELLKAPLVPPVVSLAVDASTNVPKPKTTPRAKAPEEGNTWRRIVLRPGVELHVKEGAGFEENVGRVVSSFEEEK